MSFLAWQRQPSAGSSEVGDKAERIACFNALSFCFLCVNLAFRSKISFKHFYPVSEISALCSNKNARIFFQPKTINACIQIGAFFELSSQEETVVMVHQK